MIEHHQTQMDTRRMEHYDDEIELMDYLLVIWKWKYLILTGTLVFALAAAIISFAMPKPPIKYRVDMLIEPEASVDSAVTIKALIDAGIFNSEISNHITGSNRSNLPTSFLFNVSVPQGLNLLKVSCETENVDSGEKILGYLGDALSKHYAGKKKLLQDGYENSIKLKKIKLADLKIEAEAIERKNEADIRLEKSRLRDLKAEEEKIKKDITHIEKILAAVREDGKRISENIQPILDQKNDSITNDKNNPFLIFMVQQYLSLQSAYYDRNFKFTSGKEEAALNLYKIQKQIEDVSKEIKELERQKNDSQSILIHHPDLYNLKKQVENISEQIEELEREKNNIQTIQILQPPTVAKLPIKKTSVKQKVVLASVAGLFLMIFLAFFLNYIRMYKSKMQGKGAL